VKLGVRSIILAALVLAAPASAAGCRARTTSDVVTLFGCVASFYPDLIEAEQTGRFEVVAAQVAKACGADAAAVVHDLFGRMKAFASARASASVGAAR